MVQDQILLNDWHVIARSQDLQPGTVLHKRLLGSNIVLWHNGDKVLAWQDVCPHRGARLSLGYVNKETLVCPYHGLAFNSEGKCVQVPANPEQSPPAQACVKTYQIQERYDLLWVCLGTPKQDIAPFSEWYDPVYQKIFCGPYYYHSSPLRVLENFIDPAHFPIMHSGLFAHASHPELTHYELESLPDGISFKCGLWELDFNSGNPLSAPLIFNTYDYHIFRPLVAYFKLGPGDHRLNIFYTITPVDEDECVVQYWLMVNSVRELKVEVYLDIQNQIASQDIAIVESQQPRRLPLDLQSEVHLPSDRYSIAYRKWLKQQGVTFGTI
ncbi:MAG: Rieske 2Fe-2S domain-containing protein [Nostoc sp. EfeVER01]|uniref:aromatic ring-hydroxylating dioxygenase subunit alpha n=1 Tax=unclassified Nostoc TaxID=2593658 RepID=UPI002AD4F17C|nr:MULTISPECIES: aromatic ring-hydroxylating dioxygenase subunit alpha [unclassified Nostoc]MDZ7943708.1 aromatic ring-hydroxylating dioxygenase subunit alpha [Nostoc sp. EfeVER01]MDZ7991715.1 aromatic ring-hydroxylating dioxygenase subunit alpha [Nostoc sp. EspVER01]